MPQLISQRQFRNRFPAFREGLVHLASGSAGALSGDVDRAVQQFTEVWRRQGAPWEAWMGEVEQARQSFARLINAKPSQVAVVSSASAGAYALASSLNYSKRNRIVTTTGEFPSVAFVWHGQQKRGAEVRFVDSNLAPTVKNYLAAINKRTVLVSVPQVVFYQGYRPDIKAMIEAARDAGAYSFVDAYQGLGVVPIDVQKLGVDFLVCGAVKYLLGLSGIAFLYVREGLEEKLEPTPIGWFAHQNPLEFDPTHFAYAPSASRFQDGTFGISAAYGTRAALDLLLRVPKGAIWKHAQELAGYLQALCAEHGLQQVSPTVIKHRGPQVAIRVSDPNAVAAKMLKKGFVISPRKDVVRLSLHYYNNHSDLEGAVKALRLTMGRGTQ
jgi:selenocysteine lyase/cysteine desulfurase